MIRCNMSQGVEQMRTEQVVVFEHTTVREVDSGPGQRRSRPCSSNLALTQPLPDKIRIFKKAQIDRCNPDCN